MKKIGYSIIILLLVLIMSACSEQTSKSESTKTNESSEEQQVGNKDGDKTQVIFWHSMGGTLQETLDSLVNKYNQSQNEYEIVAEYQGSYEEALTKLRSVGGTDDAPAIMQTFEVGTKYMIDSGFFEPIQTFIDKEDYDMDLLEENIVNYYKVEGKFYSMPFNSSTPVLIYNKDAFTEVGLEADKAPRTYSEIKEAAKKLTTVNGNVTDRYGFSMLTYGWFFEQLLATQGGLYVDENNGRSGDAENALFNGEEGLRIFNLLNDMNKAGTFGNFGSNWDDIRAAFQSGKVAMYMDSSSGVRTAIENSPFEVGVGFIPFPDNMVPQGVVIGGASLWLSKEIDESIQEGAWNFMKYLQTPEIQAIWHVETGYFAITPAAYDEQLVKDEHSKYPQLKVTVEQLQSTKSQPATQGALISVFPESRQQVVTALENLYQGMAPQEALDQAAKGTERAMEIANRTKK
ncbi:ABC transporter substrate-binding protein [Chengkuizengella sediminis]|uniref:ABC transporter substrate-binding protein n=1 Tax=Chengkuizengella sediminis TaxID=1885917 RepID=UPI001F0DE72A|nr:ABC transporter substrate-binding protein [Chengkuizengella sediminis]